MAWETGYKALQRIQEIQEQRNTQRQSGDRILNLWKTSEPSIARFWFVTDIDRMMSPLIHKVPGPNGFPKDVTCARDAWDSSGDVCALCVERRTTNNRDIKGPFQNMTALVWLEFIAYTEKPRDEKIVVEAMRRAGRFVYLQHVEETRLLLMQRESYDYFFNAYLKGQDDPQLFDPTSPEEEDAVTEPQSSETPSLMTRPFKMVTKLKDGKKMLDWDKYDEATPPEAVEEARKKEYDLSAIIRRNYGEPPFVRTKKADDELVTF